MEDNTEDSRGFFVDNIFKIRYDKITLWVLAAEKQANKKFRQK